MLATLGSAIGATQLIEQDAAYYAEVTERFVAGEGLTSLSDRRGSVSEPVELPTAFRASTLWPVLLAPAVAVTGEARYTGSWISLVALVATLWVATSAVVRVTGGPSMVAAACVCAALLTRKACEVATLPLTDAVSLLVTAAVLVAIIARRPLPALALAALAVAVRFQNVALVLPLVCLLPPGRVRARAGLAVVVATIVAVLATAGLQALEGVWVFVNPTHRDSLLRAIRWLTIPALVGLWLARSLDAPGSVFWLLGAGHLLVLLASFDSSDDRPWLFANRQGLPLHLAAAGLSAVTLTRGVRHRPLGLPLLAMTIMVCIAFLENGARPYKVWRGSEERTSRPEVFLARDVFREHELPAGAVVMSHDCDAYAYMLRIGGVHLRGHEPGPDFAGYLRERRISHVLLTWYEHKHLRARNERMDQFERCLRGKSDVVADVDGYLVPARALLLRVLP